MPNFKIGPGKKEEGSSYFDAEWSYVNKKYFIEFFHIPTGRSVQFKAMITRYSDQYTSNWKDEDVYGRSDPISNFINTRRGISLGWSVVAASEQEAKENLQRSSLLLSMLYPVYDKSSGKFNASSIVASPLMKLSFANLIRSYGEGNKESPSSPGKSEAKAGGTIADSGLVGKVAGFTYEPDLNAGMFDPEPAILHPKTVNLSCEFTVLHTTPLGWNREKNKRTPLFPYGERDFDDLKLKEVNNSSKTGGTDAQRSAQANKVLGVK